MPDDLHIRHGADLIAVPVDRPFVIGRAHGADLRVSDARVSRRHLVIEATPAGWQAVDLSTNGTWANGQRFRRVLLDRTVLLSLGALDGPRLVLLPTQVPGGAVRTGSTADLPVAVPAPVPAAPAGTSLVANPADLSSPPAVAVPEQRPASVPEQPETAPVEVGAGQPEDGDDHHERDTLLAGSERAEPGPMLPPGEQAGVVPGPTGRVVALRPGRMTIGRSRANDIVVGDLLASREHAELFVGRSGTEIADLRSANGTFVNGQRVERAVLHTTDLVAIGHHVFQVAEETLVEFLDSGDVTFEADGLSAWEGDTRILRDVTFRLPARALMAVIGPGGSGTSVLLRALTGLRPADTGTVRYRGRDLYAEYAELRHRVGYVPQGDLVHTGLTVRQALDYGARLRFPADTTAAERAARVHTALGEVGLNALAEPEPGQAPREPGTAPALDTKIAALAGDARRRVSIALELLTEPTLLVLDDPTAGLDPGLDLQVTDALRALADRGRTVVFATHQVAQIDRCDVVLVLARGGTVAYFGPPREALAFLGAESWSQAYQVLGTSDGADNAARRYRESPAFVEHSPRAAAAHRRPAPLPARGRLPVLSQLATLSRRCLRVIAADPSCLRQLVMLPLLLGLIPRLIAPTRALTTTASGQPSTTAALVLVALILCAVFLGAASSIREIVREREIYRRERATGLSMLAYLGSKIGVLVPTVTAQSIALTVVGVAGRMPRRGVLSPFPLLDMMIAVALVAIASAMTGLAISALVDSIHRTTPLLLLLTMPQLAFTGAFMRVAGAPGLEEIAALSPARFGFAAAGSVLDLDTIERQANPLVTAGVRSDPLWAHTASTYLTDLGAIAAIALISLVVSALLLRRFDPRVGRRRLRA